MLLARLLLVATTANAWQRWEYEADATQQWKELWGWRAALGLVGVIRSSYTTSRRRPRRKPRRKLCYLAAVVTRSSSSTCPLTYEIKISAWHDGFCLLPASLP